MAEPGQGFYPYQAAIDGYGNGGFRFAGMSHRGSLLCLPTGMHAWEATVPGEITMDNLVPVFAVVDQIDVLLVGLGTEITGFDKAIRQALRDRKVIVEAIATGGAVRTYNILLGENRAVGAALIAVESLPVKAESATYASSFLRENDRDRYLATLVLPAKEREAVTALYAFSADVAVIRERAREPAAGEIRLQWWADALGGDGHGNVRSNPLADALLSVITEYGLPVPPLSRLITARRFDLYQDPMPDVPTFEGYAGETVSALYQLAAMVLNGGRPVEPGDAAGHLGVAHALVGHLRAFGYNASQGRIFLPWNVFAVCGVTEGEVLAGQGGERVTVALTRLAETAAEHLDKAAVAIRELPKSLRPAFAPIATVRSQLKRLDLETPFQRPADLPDWRKIAALTLEGWR